MVSLGATRGRVGIGFQDLWAHNYWVDILEALGSHTGGSRFSLSSRSKNSVMSTRPLLRIASGTLCLNLKFNLEPNQRAGVSVQQLAG